MAITRNVKGDPESDIQHGNTGARREIAEIHLHGPYGPRAKDAMICATVFDHAHKATTLRLSMSTALDLRNALNDLINSRERKAACVRAILARTEGRNSVDG